MMPANAPVWGQIALGVSGHWEVAVDETVAGPQAWVAQIDGLEVSLTLDLDSPEVIEKAAEFFGSLRLPGETNGGFENTQSCGRELELGRFAGCAVCLVRDTEFHSRCFLLIQGPDRGALRWTITERDFGELSEAFSRAAEELLSAGPNLTQEDLARRAEEIRSGHAQGKPADQVFAELRKTHS